ncbi:MAG TPA: ATP-binding cassette domain-containing protein [Methanoregulaceae archaeon]|nr:ATP-binding cassette domain-containing protein [Methanoregulaceae archaeon]HQJ88351.1 ATP-binding cassette domain-containing protein [Methanoregulaceae archaeon]
MAAIETSGLTKQYDALTAVDSLDLAVDREVFGLLGPNGSGKTTTVLMLTTLLRPTRGSARVCGHDVVDRSAEVRERISYVPQDMAVDIKLTGRENVRFYARLYGVDDKDLVDEVLGVMDLADRADDLVRTYSGGMRRRLELAQALVHDPEVLFLDEPTIGLDVAGRQAIWNHIGALRRRGMTIFVTTHYMDEADRACDRVGIIAKGRLVAVDTPLALRHRLDGERIAIETDRPVGPVVADGLRLVGVEGERQVYHAPDAADVLPALLSGLAARGARVQSLEVQAPTLDDVFLALAGRQDDGGAFDFQRFRTMLRRRG